jgi:hypothetical protein
MTGRAPLSLGVLAIILGSTGCITAGYDGARLARDAGPSCETPVANREQVYVFVLGGVNPVELAALDKFREGLNSRGFSKVATGPLPYYPWMVSELRRIHKENANAVFVIAGLDSSAGAAVKLSEKAESEGIPVRAVVIVDPSGKTEEPKTGVRTLNIGSSYAIQQPKANTETVVITTAGNLGLSAETRTLTEVARLLNEIAITNLPPIKTEVVSDCVYPFAPDVELVTEPRFDGEWSYMFDQPGGMIRPIDEPLDIRLTAPLKTAPRDLDIVRKSP